MKKIFQVVDRLRSYLHLETDGEVADALNMSGTALSNHKRRGSIPYEPISTLCELRGISFDWLLTGEGPKERGEEKRDIIAAPTEDQLKDFVHVPQVSGEISAGGGLAADNIIEMRIAFRKDWIQRKGDPRNMSLIRVRGDSMEPTLLSGDMVLVDHGRNYIDPEGGLYAIALDDTIMIKRLQLLYPAKKVRIISDNDRYETLEADPDQIKINGKVVWFGREIER